MPFTREELEAAPVGSLVHPPSPNENHYYGYILEEDGQWHPDPDHPYHTGSGLSWFSESLHQYWGGWDLILAGPTLYDTIMQATAAAPD